MARVSSDIFGGETLNRNSTVPTVKHEGGSVMLWNYFSVSRTGALTKVNGIMKEDNYLQILKISSNQTQVIMGTVVFQQDNDPTHISKVMNEWINQTRTSSLYKRNKSVPGSQQI